MYKYILFISILSFSCSGPGPGSSNETITKEEVTGNWLILYPQHILKNDVQRKIYGKNQDSIVNLMGLKLISFGKNGEFLEVDSLFGDHGKWMMDDSLRFNIRAEGKGFKDFNGKLDGLLNDTLLVSEIITIENEPMKLMWHIKKISSDHDGADLFKLNKNLWRQKPTRNETGEEIKKRVISMLQYYSLYFKVVSVESIYFSPVRVHLPFTYYQNGVGLKSFNAGDPFTNYFFTNADAKKGYDVIKAVVEDTKYQDFPSGKNFVIEYSEYFGGLAKKLSQ